MKINRYKIIPEKNTIRFRNTKNRFEIYLSWIPEMRSINENPEHEMFSTVNEVFPSETQLELAEIIHELASHMAEYVDYFESNEFNQVICVNICDMSISERHGTLKTCQFH